ncbi:deazaflavin-dependent oxidoreductase (nitroreductase family) [Lipingzhangella halophila]|uniref:Deazaflavin-dependent oxidoreductase (Nitroreductase family) n=1 Tax=Lipingzhangella halophila TaxID=1783352 RepID=A0A7W7W6F3_9ACTN|nr:nitroreductase/quinone reductase family protein [Lipingzhangella halophila]MBB4934800.1 deazaflavin-dependent oxidoreductase (nitroreductase family) [Lipingzhangella halophila]
MSFNEQVITEFRANGGRVESAAGFGSNLVLIHSRGAQTGRERVNPALALRDGDGWLVIGSAKGAPKHPGWVFNLRADPDAEIEVPGAAGVERVAVTAAELTGSEHERAFARFVERSPAFATYQSRAGRTLPVIRFTPRPGPATPDLRP